MNANTSRPAPIERAPVASTDHIDEELRRYDEHLRDVRGLTSWSDFTNLAQRSNAIRPLTL